MVNNTLRRTALLSAMILTAAWQTAWAAEIAVRTDRGTIRMNEAFTLTFNAQGSVDADPDFSPLQQDFEIAGTSQNSSFTIINGQTEGSINWMVTVFPKRAGTLTVPPIRFGSDLSPQLQIEVQAAADPGITQNKEVFITIEAEPDKPYAQAQTLVTVRLYRIPNMGSENLSQLELDSNDVIVHPLDEGKNFSTHLYGRQYNVHERQYAVFPQQPGLLRIKPLHYSGVRMASRRGFFTDPFGSAGSRPVRIISETVSLDVRPPAVTPWLPAARLQLEEKWSGEPGEFKVGEPLTRRLRITATGLTAEQLPELTAVAVDGFKQYPDQPALENRKSETGITGVREESVAFMPTRPGTYVLPAVEIKWWNTKTGKEEVARAPERTVTVAPSPDGNAAAPALPSLPAEQTQSGAADIKPESAIDISPRSGSVWFRLSLLLALCWILTGILWWHQSRKGKASGATVHGREQADSGKAERMLEQACRQNRADAAKDALLNWARARWRAQPPQSLDAIAARSRDEALSAQLQALNARLYAPGATTVDWDGKALWQAFNEYRKSMANGDSAKTAPSLPPLHKI